MISNILDSIGLLTSIFLRSLIFIGFSLNTSRQKKVTPTLRVFGTIGFILIDLLSSMYVYDVFSWIPKVGFVLLCFSYLSIFCLNHVIENIVLAFTYYITFWFTTYAFDEIVFTWATQFLDIPHIPSEYISTIAVSLLSFIVIDLVLPRIIDFHDTVLDLKDFYLIMIFCLFGFFSLFFYQSPTLLLMAALSDVAIVITFSDIKSIKQKEKEKQLLAERNKFLEEQDKLIKTRAEEKYKSYQKSIVADEQIRRIHHDLMHHFNCLLNYEGMPQQAINYINSLKGEVNKGAGYFDTGSSVVDLILEEKCRAAEKDGIKFKVMGDLSEGVNVEPASLSIILGNLLNNAFEGVKKVDKEKFRVIDVCFYQEPKREFYLKVLNSADTDNLKFIDGELETSKTKDKELHGIGLKSVRQEVKKYGGTVSILAQNGIFTVEVKIPVK